jgi:hypothetical protein
MAAEGINLLGANQWQALQFQEATKNLAAIPHAQEANAVFQLPQTLPLTPTQTSQAVHLEAMPDRLELSLGDSLQSKDGEGQGHDSAEDTPQDNSEAPSQRWEPGTLEEARIRIAQWTPSELNALAEHFAPTSGERQQLASLLPTAAGPFGTYARQAILTANPIRLLTRILHACTHARERTIKLLSVLKATTESDAELGGLFALLLERSMEQDQALPTFLEDFALRLETMSLS